MKTIILILIAAFCICLALPLHAEEKGWQGTAARVEPFVNRLKAAVRGPQVKLTWRDSADLSADYLVYRHTREITPENFKQAALVVRVERGQELYIDAPPETGTFFYAVLAVTPEGTVYDVFIPFRNKTTTGIVIDSTLSEEELAAALTFIAARAEDDKIVVTFAASRADRDLMLFRSTSPILSSGELLITREARRVKSLETRITDYPVAGIPYYYALVDEKILGQGNIRLEAGRNATRIPAEIPLREGTAARGPGAESSSPEDLHPLSLFVSADSSRSMPLPLYILESKVSADGDLSQPASALVPPYRRISLAAENASAGILARTSPPFHEQPRPTLLATDTTRAVSREDYALATVLKSSFAEKNWTETERLCENFLSMHISDDARARGRFYKAQALFFQKKYTESFMDFLLAETAYPAESRDWIEKVLDAMRL
ncbi:MAG: hypothetical protein FWG35_03440 [Spirochaetaceae bacterium]|nr:hypothetical protein [Spirochaetaceae bacterium]